MLKCGVVSKLPKSAKKGDCFTLKRNGRLITYERRGDGRMPWRIKSNKKV